MDPIFNMTGKQGEPGGKDLKHYSCVYFPKGHVPYDAPTLPTLWKEPSEKFPKGNVSVSRCCIKSKGLFTGLSSLISLHFMIRKWRPREAEETHRHHKA